MTRVPPPTVPSRSSPSRLGGLVLALTASGVVSTASADDDLFELAAFPNQGRSVASRIADLNGDGRPDLFVVSLVGIPPEETRTIAVYLQKPSGGLPELPDYTLPLPAWSAVYDVADLRPDVPGEELVLLQPDRVTILSLATPESKQWHVMVPGPTTVGLADDERGFEPYRLVYRDFGDEPWILVPQIGQLTAVTASGEVKATFAVPRRANYFILPSTGLVSIESDFQIFLDVPKLSIGDIDGDGQVDVASSTRHEIRVFLRREDGSYSHNPDRRLPLRLVTPRDHIRASGGVASEIKDIDGDGRMDLLISHVQGGFGDATTRIHVYLNRDGHWALGAPDQTLETDASLGSNALFDIDQDGTSELVRLELSFSVLEVIELLLSREVDIDISIHRFERENGRFGRKPWMKKKLSIPFSFETFRTKGFIPVANIDVNSDGFLDIVQSGGGSSLEVYLGNHEGPFAKRGGRQKMSTAGVIQFGDFDRDGLTDFVLFDPHNFDAPVRLAVNTGWLEAKTSGKGARRHRGASISAATEAAPESSAGAEAAPDGEPPDDSAADPGAESR